MSLYITGASKPMVTKDNLQRRREKESKITDYGLESSVLEKLKMRNFMENIKKVRILLLPQ